MVDAPRSLTLEANQEETWAALRQFYVKNQASIEQSQSLNVNQGHLQEKLDQVLETSQVLLDGLVALANVHPVVGVAVFAFHGMVKLDITRRENNRKVLVVKLQIQSMMSAMFQLCELKHVHVLDEPQKAAQRAQLQSLVKTIADEIKQCGSDLNYYSDRKIVSKLIKAKIYERLFAEHVETFALRRSELQSTIAAYISGGIDAANIAIGQVGQKVEVVDKKIDSLLAIFERLDTPSERELLKFIDDNGGAEKCISRYDLLKVLLAKSGQSLQAESLTDSRKALLSELSEDLDTTLARNLGRFERLLGVQNNNLERLSNQIESQGVSLGDQTVKLDTLLTTSISILEEGKLIKKAIVPHTSIRLKDPELQKIWEGMGLSNRRSVKAKQFVLTLRDYLINVDRSPAATPELHSALFLDSETPSSHLSLAVPDHHATGISVESADSDAWVLRHINAANMQSIIEAMDEDGSGFISVQEANKFALARPKGLPLLDWFAYWAAGWHYNITDYRSKIYKLMQQLHVNAQHVLTSNRRLFALYLGSDYLRIEGILRHISRPTSNLLRDPKLTEVAAAIAAVQEQRLKKNLQELSYTLRSPADVVLVIGNGRLEAWLLPLLHALLTRHLEIFSIARSRSLSLEEYTHHWTSIESIISVYQDRMRQLRDIFRPVGRDTESHFKNFAYGIFVDAYRWTGRIIVGGNTLLDFVDEASVDGTAEASPEHATPDTTILVCGPQEGLAPLELSEFALNSHRKNLQAVVHGSSGIEGRWVGSYSGGVLRSFECIICAVVDGKLEAKARDYSDVIEISGLFDAQTDKISIRLQHALGHYAGSVNATYDRSRDVIRGWWAVADESGAATNDRPKDPPQIFSMTRHTTSSFRFRNLLDPEMDASETSLARRRWAFATQTVLFDVQDRLGSWEFMRQRITERNDWIELSVRRFPPNWINVTRGFLNDEELARWQFIRRTIHPTTMAIYHAIRVYLEERQIPDVGPFFCDVCNQNLIFRQYMCITCIEDNYSHCVNFCVDSNCSEIQTTFSSNDFVHSPSHTLLRATERIHLYELPAVVSQARILSEGIKLMFREQKAGTTSQKVGSSSDGKARPTCSCCGDPLTLPCWVCAVCVRSNVLFCRRCEKSFEKPLKPRGSMPDGHSHHHYLLRVNDSHEAKLVKKNTHDKRMDDMEGRLNNRLQALEDKLAKQNLEGRMATLETKVDSLVSLIQQMIETIDKGKGTTSI